MTTHLLNHRLTSDHLAEHPARHRAAARRRALGVCAGAGTGAVLAGLVILGSPASGSPIPPEHVAVSHYVDIGDTVALRKEMAAQYAVDHAAELAAQR